MVKTRILFRRKGDQSLGPLPHDELCHITPCKMTDWLGVVAIAMKDDYFLCNERGREENGVAGHQGCSADSDANAIAAKFNLSSIILLKDLGSCCSSLGGGQKQPSSV